MSHRPATSHPCAIWFGSPDTVAALLRRDVRSHHIVAYPLRTSGRSASFCRCLATPISCMHLMPAIRCVWSVTYTFNALPAPCAWRGHDGPDVRRLGNARVRPGAESHWTRDSSGALPHQEVGLEPQGTCRYRSPAGRWSRCLGHAVTLEPPCAGVGPGATSHVASPEPSPVV
jgi:hypothetical protein